MSGTNVGQVDAGDPMAYFGHDLNGSVLADKATLWSQALADAKADNAQASDGQGRSDAPQTPPDVGGSGPGDSGSPGLVASAFRSAFGHVDPNQWAARGAVAGGVAGGIVGGVAGGTGEGLAGAGIGSLALPGGGTIAGGAAGAVDGAIKGTAIGGVAGTAAGGVIGKAAGEFILHMAWGDGDPVSVNQGHQDKHIQGTNNYDPTRSTLTADPQQLLNSYSGKGQPVNSIPRGQPGFRERFDTGNQVIGTFTDGKTGISQPTTSGTIHYSKDGAHIVPALPKTKSGE